MKQNRIEIETPLTYGTAGINTLSLLSTVMLAGHIFGNLSLWFLPVTLFLAVAAFGFEVSPRAPKQTFKL